MRTAAAVVVVVTVVPVVVAAVVVACYSAATNLDVVQVRHYFPHRASGLYAAASLVGRAVLLASLSITMLVFPQFARSGRHDDQG